MKYITLSILTTILFSSCFIFYTFKDISIEPDVKTFYVENFDNIANNSPSTINQDFSEAIRKKVLDETSLTYDDTDPHIIFSGNVSSFTVTAQAPSREGAALNRLQIKVKVNFINILHEEENWDKSFSYYSDFSIDSSLEDVQEALIEEIFEHILEDIINKSFNNW